MVFHISTRAGYESLLSGGNQPLEGNDKNPRSQVQKQQSQIPAPETSGDRKAWGGCHDCPCDAFIYQPGSTICSGCGHEYSEHNLF